MSLALLLGSLASAASDDPWATMVADGLGEAWSDGLTHRAPTVGGFARVDGTAVATPSGPMFGSVTAGGAAAVDGEVALGATVTMSAFSATLATGTQTAPQALGGELWVTTTWESWRHGASLGYYDALGDTSSWYLRHPTESGQRFLGRYVGFYEGGRMDVVLESRLAFGERAPVELATSGAFVVEVTPWFAASAAAEVGLLPLGTVMAGLHLRPVDHTELGITLATPFPLLSSAVRSEPQVGGVVKAWF